MADQKQRVLNRKGEFNGVRVGLKKRPGSDLYHSLLIIGWGRFLGLLFSAYLLINFLFAILYVLCGPDALEGARDGSLPTRLSAAFFFSVQTFATIGYGKITPNGLLPNLLVTLEALVGLLGLALATGLLFARFSRPTARVIFSNVAVVEPHDGVPSVIFRIANRRKNQIVEAQVSVVLVRSEKTEEGEQFRNLYDLELERGHSPILANTWTIVHPITEASPLYGATPESLVRDEAELIVSLNGIDDIFSQPVHARFSYVPEEILWNQTFEDILSWLPDGTLQIDLGRIHNVKEREA